MKVEAERTTTGPCLAVVRDLTDRLDRAGIRYCQFKSNQHLEAGLTGLTDIDLLVDRQAGPALPLVLSEAGCRRFSSHPGADHPAVEDYLAMDRETGRLIHLHLHHRLAAGERHLKGYRVPFEHLILSTRRREGASGFYIADPDVEFVCFSIRAALKIRLWERLLGQWAILFFRGEAGREWAWLQERIEPARLAEIARAHLGERAARSLEQIRVRPSLAELIRLRRAMVPPVRLYRLFTPVGATVTRWRRECALLRSRAGKRWLPLPGPVSRTEPRGGVLIAIVGPDGSGKSTLVREIDRWLRWKIDSRLVYFGSGDGPSSWLRWPMKMAAGMVRAARLRRAPGDAAPQPAGGSAPTPGSPDGRAGAPAGAERLARAAWALVLAAEKRRSLRRAWRLRNRGIVVLCDRYPQNQVMGFNDGPLLSHWNGHRSRLLRLLARWEAVPYAWAEAIPPDLVIKLHITPEVSRQRKPEVRLDDIRRREQAVAGFRYPPQTRIADIDAGRPWEEVLLDAKRQVWEML